MFKRLLLSALTVASAWIGTQAQVTTVIGPGVNNGDFENATPAWNLVNGTQTNKWVIDGGATAGFSGLKSAYVSNSTASPYAHTYTNTSSSTVYLYQDVTLPAGQANITLTFKAIQGGENSYDQCFVLMSTGTPGAAPTAGSPTPTSFAFLTLPTGYQQLSLVPVQSTPSWTTYTVTIPASLAGNATATTTRRLAFMWINDGSVGVNPPIGVDDVNMVASCNGPTVTASAITTSSATLSWTALAGATSYQVRYRRNTDPTTVATWATPTVVTGTTVNLTGLSASKNYVYEVSALAGTGCPAPTAGSFNTLCGNTALPYSETFESITANNTLPVCMASITPIASATNVQSFISTQSTSQTNHTPGGDKYVSFRWTSADRYLFTPAFSLTAGTTYKMSFWYITDGFSGWDSLRAVVSSTQTAAGIVLQGSKLSQITNTTYQEYVQNFTPTTSGVYYFGIQLKGTSSPNFMSVDDINIVELVPCTGTPTVSNITGITTTCPSQPFTLTANGYSQSAGGLTFQWQSASSCSGPWTNISGATATTYVSPGITAATSYRVVITCSGSGQSIASNCFTVGLNSFFNCYCNSAAGSTGDEDIGQVTVGTYANPAIPPATLTSPAYNATYTNFRSLPPIQLARGNNYPVTVTQVTAGSFYGTYLKAYIDYNHNGLLTDVGEEVLSLSYPTTGSPQPGPHFFGNFTVPANALSGLTLMRFILVEGGSASNGPCYNYTWGETEDYLVEIPGKPDAPTVANNGPVCAGDSVTITAISGTISSNPATNGPQFLLSGPGIATPITNTTGIFRVATPFTGTTAQFAVRVRAYNLNSDTTFTVVTLNPNPAPTIGTVVNPSTCTGTDGSIQLANLANSSGFTLTYRRNGTRVAPFTITSSATGTYTITGLNVATYDSIQVTNTTGCRSSILGPVALVPPAAPPTPFATYNQPLCLGSTLTMQVQNPNTAGIYNWFGPNGYTATGPTATRANLSYADTGLYSVTVNVGGCISAPFNIRTYITPPSPAPTASTQFYCQNTPSYPLTAQGVNLEWYTTLTGGTSQPSINPITNTPGSAVDTQRFYVTQNTNGCPSRPRTQVLAIIRPQPGVPATPSTNLVYCQFEVVPPLTATGSNLKFYTTQTGGTGVPTLTPSTSQPGLTSYYVTQTISGCESERLEIKVQVKPKPAPPVVSSPINLCQYAVPVPLTATGQNLVWYDVDTGGTGLPDAPLPYTGYLDTMDYYVTQTINGCESDRANINVVVNYTPNATFVPSKQFVCVDDTISFIYYGNALPDAEYNWFIPSPAGTPVSGQGTQGPFVARFNQVGTFQVRLIVNNKGCISSPVWQSFEVRSRPDVRIDGKREICIGEVTELTLDSLSPNISGYNWDFGDGTVVYGTQNTGPYGVKWETPGIKAVIVNTVSRDCGSYARREEINVHNYPAATILNKPTGAVCAGDSIRLQANDLGPGYSYLWSPATAFRSYERSGTTVWAVATNDGAATNIVLTVTDNIGCKGEDRVSIQTQPCCNVFFPNAFTPNADGKNDRFEMVTNGTPQISAFRVFNRWGKVVFETANSLIGWDGTMGGEQQPTGTYFYYAKYRCANGQEYEHKGEVTLLR
ncbi:MAG: T9SS type B sorting domain-containing protein [Sphingobacteriales bacterium]|nr:MAG: T9SS type B sorting domain-containing protein [Sphingobacteriales bacterium]